MSKHGRNKDTLAERDGGHRCVYCGWDEWDYGYPHLTVDHVIPTARGGPNILENKVLACSICNRKKGDRLLIATGMLINWGIYQADNPQSSQEKVAKAIDEAERTRPRPERPLPWYCKQPQNIPFQTPTDKLAE